MISWLTGTTLGKLISTFFISMVPVVELRLGLPYGIALGLDYPLALLAALIGNMVPVPFIIVYIRRIFIWIRRHWERLDGFITKLENKAHLKGETVRKYGPPVSYTHLYRKGFNLCADNFEPVDILAQFLKAVIIERQHIVGSPCYDCHTMYSFLLLA